MVSILLKTWAPGDMAGFMNFTSGRVGSVCAGVAGFRAFSGDCDWNFSVGNTGKGLSNGRRISGDGGLGFLDIIEPGDVICVEGVCGVKLLGSL